MNDFCSVAAENKKNLPPQKKTLCGLIFVVENDYTVRGHKKKEDKMLFLSELKIGAWGTKNDSSMRLL